MVKYPRILVYVSSRNNYDMLANEVFRRFRLDDLHFVNVDDFSEKDERKKGIRICKEAGVPFLPNQKRGLQYAAKTALDFALTRLPKVKFILHFQHDVYPLEHDEFFQKLSGYLESGFLDSFGAVGFNGLDVDGRNTKTLYTTYCSGDRQLIGITGVACLSSAPSTYYNGAKWKMPWAVWGRPFAVDSTVWFCVGFPVATFLRYIDVTDRYHLQLWGGDINLQFLKNNVYNVALPELYVANHMSLKTKYGLAACSAKGGKRGDDRHFGHYGVHLDVFKERWGWPWEQKARFSEVMHRYEDTLLSRFHACNVSEGPLVTFNPGDGV